MSTLVLLGGTGSLCKAITKHQDLLKSHGIKRIRIISRDEIKQAALEKEYTGDIELQCFLGDVRNKERMEFALKNADYVIHAAALKMIERFELDIEEGYETNIIGSKNVMKAALLNQVKSAVLISTDKMFQPINAYGVSKLAATHLWFWPNSFQTKTAFGVCAYGNVWSSRGSVIEHWRKLAIEKKPLPITHRDMTRFFITLEDASRFVIESLFKNNKTVMIPEMKSAEMVQVAHLINQYYNSDAGIQIVGLRNPLEKIHEDLGSLNSFEAKRFTENEIMEMIENA